MWTFLEIFICGKKYVFSTVTSLFFLNFCRLNCAFLGDSSLPIMSAKDKKSEVFSYCETVKCEFLLEDTISLNKGLLNLF